MCEEAKVGQKVEAAALTLTMSQQQPGLGSSLRKLKASSRGRRSSRKEGGPPVHSAAASHELNDKYMDTMEEAFQSLYSKENIQKQSNLAAARPTHQRLLKEEGKPLTRVSAASKQVEGGRGWYEGPSDPKGTTKVDLSDRPSLCMDLRNDCVVVGSSDHALYEVNFRKGKRTRTLYSKAYGHSEWVNAVKYFPDGKILSAGLDSKLLLWHGSAVRATELKGHSHSVSAIDVSDDGSLACSCSYDKTIRFWDISASGLSGRESQCLRGHKAPIMELGWYHNVLVSGSRDGTMILWDVLKGKPKKVETVAHQGHITALTVCHQNESLILSGGQDGCVQVRDQRFEGCLSRKYLHRSNGGAGAVGAIRCSSNGMVVTMGADKRICISDPRMSFEEVLSIGTHEDFIYSMELMDNLVVSGSGDGVLLVHDMKTGKCLYGLQGNQNAVRSLGITKDYLVASGDDGNLISYAMA